MTDHSFSYDESLLHQCATTASTSSIDGENNDTMVTGNKDKIYDQNYHHEHPCTVLFKLYVDHYRLHDLIQQEIDVFDNRNIEDDNGNGRIEQIVVTSTILEQFIRNVIMIDQYNAEFSNDGEVKKYKIQGYEQQEPSYRHRLTINRFAHQNLRNVIPPNREQHHNNYINYNQNINTTSKEAANIATSRARELQEIEHHQLSFPESVMIHHLSSYDAIRSIGNERFSVVMDANNNNKDNTDFNEHSHIGFMKVLTKYTKHDIPTKTRKNINFNLYPKKIRLPTDDMISPNYNDNNNNSAYDDQNNNLRNDSYYSAESPLVMDSSNDRYNNIHTNTVNDMDGTLMIIGSNHKKDRRKRHTNPNEESTDNDSDDIFATQINWATTNNPDGVSVVHDPIDQGNCGSCWALAATGSIEANAARRQAYMTYKKYIKDLAIDGTDSSSGSPTSSNDPIVNNEIHRNASLLAQRVEQESMDLLHLSIQELIDCDTIAVAQGCVGGNPLLAFYFIHKYGLTSSDIYSYKGYKDKCHKNKANQPIATVSSWGIIPPNSERHMELVLRYIGPIAVGFNGGDPTFLSYSGGIYTNDDCHHKSNHALLVVGYGEEEIIDHDGNVDIIPYWIARNSWGKGWGENGYVRIRRGKGSKGEPGQCGIARSPSVALGGMLLNPHLDTYSLYNTDNINEVNNSSNNGSLRGSVIDSNDNNIKDFDSSYPLSTTIAERFCVRLRQPLDHISQCSKIADYISSHKALLMGMIGIFVTLLVAVWPLTWDCRRRRANRRRKRQLQLLQQHQQTSSQQHDDDNGENDTESMPVPRSLAIMHDEATPLISEILSKGENNNNGSMYGGTSTKANE